MSCKVIREIVIKCVTEMKESMSVWEEVCVYVGDLRGYIKTCLIRVEV